MEVKLIKWTSKIIKIISRNNTTYIRRGLLNLIMKKIVKKRHNIFNTTKKPRIIIPKSNISLRTLKNKSIRRGSNF